MRLNDSDPSIKFASPFDSLPMVSGKSTRKGDSRNYGGLTNPRPVGLGKFQCKISTEPADSCAGRLSGPRGNYVSPE